MGQTIMVKEVFEFYNKDFIVSPIKLQRYRTFKRSKFKLKTCIDLAKHCPFACARFFERSLALQLYGTYYKCFGQNVDAVTADAMN